MPYLHKGCYNTRSQMLVEFSLLHITISIHVLRINMRTNAIIEIMSSTVHVYWMYADSNYIIKDHCYFHYISESLYDKYSSIDLDTGLDTGRVNMECS